MQLPAKGSGWAVEVKLKARKSETQVAYVARRRHTLLGLFSQQQEGRRVGQSERGPLVIFPGRSFSRTSKRSNYGGIPPFGYFPIHSYKMITTSYMKNEYVSSEFDRSMMPGQTISGTTYCKYIPGTH